MSGPEDSRLENATLLLKVMLNCDHHFEHITDSHHKGVQDPHNLFDNGVRKFLSALREAQQGHSDVTSPSNVNWYISSSDCLDKIVRNKKLNKLAKEGITDIVVASDILSYQNAPSSSGSLRSTPSALLSEDASFKRREEFIMNIDCYVDVAMALQQHQKEVIARRASRQTSALGYDTSAGSFRKQQGSIVRQGSNVSLARTTSSASTTFSPHRSIHGSPKNSLKSTSVERNVVSPNAKQATSQSGHQNVSHVYTSPKNASAPIRTSSIIKSSTIVGGNQSPSLQQRGSFRGASSTLKSKTSFVTSSKNTTSASNAASTSSTVQSSSYVSPYATAGAASTSSTVQSSISNAQTTSYSTISSVGAPATSYTSANSTTITSAPVPSISFAPKEVITSAYVEKESALEKFLKQHNR